MGHRDCLLLRAFPVKITLTAVSAAACSPLLPSSLPGLSEAIQATRTGRPRGLNNQHLFLTALAWLGVGGGPRSRWQRAVSTETPLPGLQVCAPFHLSSHGRRRRHLSCVSYKGANLIHEGSTHVAKRRPKGLTSKYHTEDKSFNTGISRTHIQPRALPYIFVYGVIAF